MEHRPNPRPWQPKPFSIAVLDSDEYLADMLCARLHGSGFNASAFYDIAALMTAHRNTVFDAYVLDYLADWRPPSTTLETLIASIRGGNNRDVPVFILGNQVAPERIEGLGDIIMRYKVRYVLKPVEMSYLAKRITEAIAQRAGL
jgi:DNA-binding response OmpR family regulator